MRRRQLDGDRLRDRPHLLLRRAARDRYVDVDPARAGERVELKRGARVTGDIEAPIVIMEEGAAAGVAIAAGSEGDYGTHVALDHHNRVRSLLGHREELDVEVGQWRVGPPARCHPRGSVATPE
jgi:hypothetical protein